jgi:hypothetical protein
MAVVGSRVVIETEYQTRDFAPIDKLLGVLAKVDNADAALPAKAQIRQHVLDAMGAGNARVFDAFAGEGKLYRRVWRQAASYVGCDLKRVRDERLMYAADSRHVMRALPLQEFSIFDFEAYGSPWEHVIILCVRRRLQFGERLRPSPHRGLLVETPIWRVSRRLTRACRFSTVEFRRAGKKVWLHPRSRLGSDRGTVGRRIIKRWEATGKTGANVHYAGVILQHPLS